MTISQILNKTYKKFKNAEIKSYFMDAEILLAHVLKNTREYILAHPDKKLKKLQVISYKLQVRKRLKGYSIAYLTGYKEFYGLNFTVNKHTLIPRPETELIVEEALRITHNTQRITLIDIGTGSGCIIISLAKTLLDKNLKPSTFNLIASDISKNALKIAKQNAKYHQVNRYIKFFHGNLLKPILKSKILNPKSKTIILANLPYLTPDQVKNSPSIQKEPKSALVAGDDGLKFYRELLKQIKKLNEMFNIRCVICEIDPSQKNSIKNLAKKYFPNCEIEIKKDLNQKNRLAIIKIKQQKIAN